MERINLNSLLGRARRVPGRPGFIVGMAYLATAFVCFGQGTILLNNRVPGTVVAPIFSCDPDCTLRTGNTPSGYPPGTQVYFGAPLAGDTYTAQLWYAPGVGQPESALVAASQTTTFYPTNLSGFLKPITVTLPGVVPGMTATLQLRVWDNRGGAVATWVQAVSDPTVAKGASPLFITSSFGDGGILPPGVLLGLVSFNICPSCPPSILTQPQNQLALPGGTAKFTVTASGAVPLSYRWRFNGGNLSDGGRISGAMTSALVISNAQAADAGAYSVTVSNAFGSANSSTAMLSLGRVLFTGIQALGSNCFVSFLTVTGAQYQLQYSADMSAWSPVTTMVGTGGTNTVTLPRIPPERYFRLAASPAEGGLITYSENLVGYADRVMTAGTNTVFNPFRNVQLQTAIPYAPDGTVVFVFTGSGYSIYQFDGLSYVWVPTGSVVLPAGTNFTVLAPTAFLFTLAGEVAGPPPPEPPVITKGPASQSVAAGSTVFFSVEAAGPGPLSYQWRFDGIDLPGATNSALKLSAVQTSQAGSYRVRVTNPGGSVTSSGATLEVLSVALPLPLSDFTFDSTALDAFGNSPPAELVNTVFTNHALYLNGIYGFGTPDAFSVVARVPGLSYNAFTVAVDFYPFDFLAEHNTMLVGGRGYRWLSFRTSGGNLQLTLNNQSWNFVFTNAPVSLNAWHKVVCAIDVAQQKVITFLDSTRLEDIYLGPGFQFEVVGTPYEETDKEFTFSNYSNGMAYYGLAANLTVFGRALSPAEISLLASAPPAILLQPVDATVSPGAAAQFSVVAAGELPLSYQWTHNGQVLTGATEATLVLPAVQPQDTGTYQVTVANAFGATASAVATLNLATPSIIEFGAANLVVAECTLGISIPIVRTGYLDREVTVAFSTFDGTTTAGLDYYAAGGTITIPAGQSYAWLFPHLIDDALVEADEVLYLALSNPGTGATLGAQTNVTVRILDNDTPSGAGSGPNWYVHALAVQPDGKTLIGGDFEQVNAVNRAKIARLNSDGSVDPTFDPGTGPNNLVHCVALQPDGKTLISGYFTSVSGGDRMQLARLNANGSLDASFDPGMGANGFIHQLAVQPDGRILLAGEFTAVGGVARNHIARLNANGTVDTSFDPGSGADYVVQALGLQPDGRVVLSGWFSTFNGTAVGHLARLNANGSLDSTFSAGALDAPAEAIIPLSDGKLLLGGQFTMVNNIAANHLARLNINGSLDPAFSAGSGPNSTVVSMALQPDGRILVGGGWTTWNGTPRLHIARVNPDGTLDHSLAGPGANGSVTAVALLPDGRAAVAGDFTVFSGYNRYRFALLGPDGSMPAEPVNWVRFPAGSGGNDHWYALTGGPTDWTSAEAEAVACGGHLATVRNLSEEHFLEDNFLRGLNRIRPVWIGLNDAASEGTFVWSSGEPVTYTHWIPGEPNDYPPGEDFTTLNWHYSNNNGAYPYEFGQWNDLPASGLFQSYQPDGPFFGIVEISSFVSPQILVPPATQTVALGSNAVFSVSAAGTPPLNYLWFFNGAPLLGATSSMLVIPNVELSAAGRYQVNVSNPSGSVTSPVASLVIVSPQTVVYSSDFESAIGPEWSPRLAATTPVGARRFLGEFGNQTVGLTLTNLPPHNVATVDFDLFILRSWDGSAGAVGPDIWSLQVGGGAVLLRTTFGTGHPYSRVSGQAYPQSYPGGPFPVHFGATAINSLGYTFTDSVFSGPMDAVYHVTVPFEHAANNLVFNFAASGLQVLTDESWGLDNVKVSVQADSAGTLVFGSGGASVSESAGNVAINVRRIGGASGSVSVDYGATSGTATPGSDYGPTTGTITFADGETNKTLTVPILNDSVPEANETFQMTLSNPLGGAVIGTPSSIPVLIVDDDGIIEFSQTIFTVAECTEGISIPVRWTGATNSDVTVYVSTADGSAVAGVDYVTWSWWFTIPAGQTNANFFVQVNDDALVEPDETFYVSLAQPSLGASLGSQINATVTILDNDSAAGAGKGVNWAVEAMAVQPDGKVLIGGGFDQVNAVARSRVARLNADGSVDSSFNPGTGANDRLETIALQADGKIVIGGWFTTFNGVARNRIARLNANGTLDTTFNPGTAANSGVHHVAVQPDGKVLLAGAFTSVSGVARNRVARLNANGTLDATFNPGSGANDAIWALALQADGKVAVSGAFTTFNGVSRSRLARLNPDGSLDTAFNTALDLRANVIIPLSDGKLLLGGRFASLNGSAANRMARLNPNGTLDTSFTVGSGPDADVESMALQPDGKILVGGDWSLWSGMRRQHVARVNPDGSLDNSFAVAPGASGYVGAVGVLPDGRLGIAGDFTVLNGFNRYRFAVINPDGTLPPDLVSWVQWTAASGGNDHWYTFNSRPNDWIGAEAEALSFGGHLVSINSAGEMSYLETTFLKGLNRIRPFWIGFNDVASEGSFVWSSGEPASYTDWGSGEPNNQNNEDYTAMNWLYSWGSGSYPAVFGQWNDLPAVGGFASGQGDAPYFGIVELSQVEGPTITSEPESQSVALGSYAVFNVSATGTPPLSYQWLFNGNPLTGATASTLVITNVLVGDGGRYQVVVGNPFGSASSSFATLVIFTPPVIVQGPRNAQVTLGSPASFDVVASSSGPLSYQWFVEGAMIPGATATTYRIAAAQLSDEGNYEVQVSGPAGSVTSDPAALNVVPPSEPPVVPSSYAVSIQPGLNLIANQLNRGGNTLNEIMPVVPDGSVVSKFDNASRTWSRSAYNFALGAWVPANIVLRPGEGAFFQSPSALSLTFTGMPQMPVLPVAVPEGQVSLLSRQTNDVGTYENIVGVAPSMGAVVYRWNTSNQTYAVYTYTESGWSGGVAPAAAIGEALWIGPTGGMPTEIPLPPVITQQPVSRTTGPGGTVTFTVAASGTEPLSYQWRLNGNRIPGATGTALTLFNVQSSQAGNYSVVVENLIGTVSSETAALTISLPSLPFADPFANAGDLGSASSGFGSENNLGATVEPGEPNPAHTPGGASVWLRWQSPGNGIARFSTAGSSFDTLLAIYTGTSLSDLVAVASDDDSAAFLCSAASFRASAGMTYYIQIDGFYGSGGNINLGWSFSEIPYEPPVILVQPQGVTVPVGSNTVLAVAIADGPLVSYQWFFYGAPIPGATDAMLAIVDMTPAQAGLYQVGVTNIQTFDGILSAPAHVQYIEAGEGQRGNPADVSAQDKLYAATDLTPPDPNIPHDPAPVGSFTGTQTFSTVGATSDPDEPNHCGYPPCATFWCSYEAPSTGLLTIDTRGTTFNAVLAVYTGPGTDYASLVSVACSANHGAGNESVSFTAYAGTQFWVVVGGIDCASGSVTVNYNLTATPNFTTLPVSQTVPTGARVTLTAAAVGAPVLGYQWRFNGLNIAGATGSAYTVQSFQSSHQGRYTVAATNLYGTNISAAATVYLNTPRFTSWGKSGTSFNVQFIGVVNTSYVFEGSPNLVNWVPVKTNSSPIGIINFSDTATYPKRFYRVRKQ
jgi:uncharacterized delta-60 repeat protein